MDAGRFDDLLRSLFASPTRRGIGRTLAGLTLGGMLGKSALAEVEARKKRRKKKCKGGKKKCGKKCRDLQTDPLHCGSCGNRCDDDMVCRDGDCLCPEGETECGETCCPSGQNCVDGQCEADLCPPQLVCPLGQACVDGDCTCPIAACAAAIDPTNDEFEDCFCAATVEGEQRCFANIACSSDPPACTTSSECGTGSACQASSCSSQDLCIPLCDLS